MSNFFLVKEANDGNFIVVDSAISLSALHNKATSRCFHYEGSGTYKDKYSSDTATVYGKESFRQLKNSRDKTVRVFINEKKMQREDAEVASFYHKLETTMNTSSIMRVIPNRFCLALLAVSYLVLYNYAPNITRLGRALVSTVDKTVNNALGK